MKGISRRMWGRGPARVGMFVCVCVCVLASARTAVLAETPSLRAGLFIKQAMISVYPHEKAGTCRVDFKAKAATDASFDSKDILCSDVYDVLAECMKGVPSDATPVIRIDAADDFALMIHLHYGQIKSFRAVGLKDSFSVKYGSVHLADQPTELNILLSDMPMVVDWDKAAAEILNSLPTHKAQQ